MISAKVRRAILLSMNNTHCDDIQSDPNRSNCCKNIHGPVDLAENKKFLTRSARQNAKRFKRKWNYDLRSGPVEGGRLHWDPVRSVSDAADSCDNRPNLGSVPSSEKLNAAVQTELSDQDRSSAADSTSCPENCQQHGSSKSSPAVRLRQAQITGW